MSPQSGARRAVITGIGLLTPLGVGAPDTWDRLLAGDSAIAPISGYDASSLRSRVGAEITGLRARDYVDRRALRSMTRYDMLASVGAALAMTDAGYEGKQDDPEGLFGLFTASGKEISEPEHFKDVAVAVRNDDGTVDMRRFGELAATQVHPLFYIEGLQAASLFYISDAFALRGPNTFFAGGAETGLTALGRAFRAVRRGEADAVLAGGADTPVCWWNMAKIDSLGLTTHSGACRPYDVDRDGTAMGEGSAFMVIEDYETARARGARVYAEITGFGSAGDVGHGITPDPAGAPLASAIVHALREAGSSPEQVDYVAAHGSGTRQGDASEAAALRDVFASRDANGAGGPAASSIKAAAGHMGAAAGAGNAAVAALAIAHGAMPPSLNLDNVDRACAGVGWVIGQARRAPVREAVAVARGLEGQNVALALRAP
jgi:3-oxoacyl-[acyl-carrier-protein] synthase II